MIEKILMRLLRGVASTRAMLKMGARAFHLCFLGLGVPGIWGAFKGGFAMRTMTWAEVAARTEHAQRALKFSSRPSFCQPGANHNWGFALWPFGTAEACPYLPIAAAEGRRVVTAGPASRIA